jgi:hypothetical protein
MAREQGCGRSGFICFLILVPICCLLAPTLKPMWEGTARVGALHLAAAPRSWVDSHARKIAALFPPRKIPGAGRFLPRKIARERGRAGSVAGACGPGRLSDSVGRFMPRKIARERGRASLVGLARSRVRAEPGRLSDWVSGLPMSRWWTPGSLF